MSLGFLDQVLTPCEARDWSSSTSARAMQDSLEIYCSC